MPVPSAFVQVSDIGTDGEVRKAVSGSMIRVPTSSTARMT